MLTGMPSGSWASVCDGDGFRGGWVDIAATSGLKGSAIALGGLPKSKPGSKECSPGAPVGSKFGMVNSDCR